jgi:hypothetical protein
MRWREVGEKGAGSGGARVVEGVEEEAAAAALVDVVVGSDMAYGRLMAVLGAEREFLTIVWATEKFMKLEDAAPLPISRSVPMYLI